MTEQEYHNHPAMSYSKLKILLECPRSFYNQYILKLEEKQENTVAMQFGTCLDLALTDPSAYDLLEVKQTKTTTLANSITEEWKIKIAKLVESINSYEMGIFFNNLTFKDVVKHATCQDMIFYNYLGLDWRMKTDYLAKNYTWFIDLKSTKAKSREEFIKDFANYGYHIQAGSYANGIKLAKSLSFMPRAFYIAISTTTGAIFAGEISEETMALGLMEVNRGTSLYESNLLTQEWAKNEPMSEFNLPDWKKIQITNNYNNYFKGIENDE